MNQALSFDDKLTVLLVNILVNIIRGLDANFNNLQIFLNSLARKPSVIICTETRNILHPEFFNLPNYTGIYNKSCINICDGVFVFIKSNLNFTSKLCIIRGFTFLNLLLLR